MLIQTCLALPENVKIDAKFCFKKMNPSPETFVVVAMGVRGCCRDLAGEGLGCCWFPAKPRTDPATKKGPA